jgi:chemotaxis protein MotB
MSSFTRWSITFAMLWLFVGMVGCQEPADDALADEQPTMSAEDRIRELQDRYDEAERARILAEEDARALRDQNDRLKAELAELRSQEPATGWTGVPGGAMTSIEGVVLFDSGKAEVKPTGRRTLDDVAAAIRQQYAGHEIYVFGHTDAEPIRVSGWKDNYELSCQRALSVVRYLNGAGVTNDMAACGWGTQRPVADSSTPSAMQANRRVEIYAMAPTAK